MKSELYIGPAGWSYPDWNGIVYPGRRHARFDFLRYLATYFNLIEINSTFYRVPPSSMCASWARRVGDLPDFQFTAKLFREFTHGSGPASRRDIDEYKRALDPLHQSGRLSTILVQFPWSFRFSADATRYVAQLASWLSPLRAAIEVRHGSWGGADAARFFGDNGIAMCGIDQPLIGDSLTADHFLPNGGVYFRLHGRNHREWFKRNTNRDRRYDYFYSQKELKEWVGRIEGMRGKVGRIHVVLNNHFRGQAVANALAMDALLSGRRVAAPPGILEHFPDMSDLLEVRLEKQVSDERPAQRSLFENGDD